MLALGARGREFDSLKSPSRGYGAQFVLFLPLPL